MSENKEIKQLHEKGMLVRVSAAIRFFVGRFFQSLKWITENTINLLRLFATLALFLIVIFVVFNAIRASNTVVVKPFVVPKSMSADQSNTGRIIANMLKQILKEEERQFHHAIYPNNNESSELYGSLGQNNNSSITDDQLNLGANIKLPETGISISDVVEFISSIFGRESVTGSVFEDNNKLHVQIELKGQVYNYFRDLNTDNKNARLDMIKDMLKESRQELLSVASADFNVNYYCTDEVEFIAHDDNKYKKWFEYCSKLRSPDITASHIKRIQTELGQASIGTLGRKDVFSGYMATLIKGRLQQKALLICQPGDGCDGEARMMAQQKKIKSVDKVAGMVRPAPMTTEPLAYEAGEATAVPVEERPEEAASAPVIAAATSVALAAIESPAPKLDVEGLIKACKLSDVQLDTQKMRMAQQAEEDATLLFRNERYGNAIDKYVDAIVENCEFVVAWANLGVLLTFADKDYRDYEGAQLALKNSITLQPDKGWVHHSLCIAEALSLTGEKPLEIAIDNESCKQARRLDPGKQVLYDKLFYIAVADHYLELKKYDEAFNVYQASMQTDKRADCRMSKVVKQLLLLEEKHEVGNGKATACAILKESYTIKDDPSDCADDLAKLLEACP